MSSLHEIIDVCEQGMDSMKFCMEGQIGQVERANEGMSRRVLCIWIQVSGHWEGISDTRE